MIRPRDSTLSSGDRQSASESSSPAPGRCGWLHFANKSLEGALRHARRLIVFLVGSTIVAIGVVMLVTPGPALLVIPLGLGVLAIEFVWARNVLRRIKARIAAAGRQAPPDSECGG